MDRVSRAVAGHAPTPAPASRLLQPSAGAVATAFAPPPWASGWAPSPKPLLGYSAPVPPRAWVAPRISAPVPSTKETLRLGGLAQIPDASMRAEAATFQRDHRRDIRAEKAVCHPRTVALITRCLQ